MAERDPLSRLRPMAEEAFAGLQAPPEAKQRILRTARAKERRRAFSFRAVPALLGVALAVVGVTALTGRQPGNSVREPAALTGTAEDAVRQPAAAKRAPLLAGGMSVDLNEMQAFTAGGSADGEEPLMELEEAAEEENALTPIVIEGGFLAPDSLFARGTQEIPVLTLEGRVYRLLREPETVDAALVGSPLGSVSETTEYPSLAKAEQVQAGISNCAEQGAAVYALTDLDSGTAVCCEVDGQMRLFQRVTYAGLSRSVSRLEDALAVRGHVRELSLSGAGTLTGEAAEAAVNALLDGAQWIAEEAEAADASLTFLLDNGLRLQLAVSDMTLVGCGVWDCPALFEAFGEIQP